MINARNRRWEGFIIRAFKRFAYCSIFLIIIFTQILLVFIPIHSKSSQTNSAFTPEVEVGSYFRYEEVVKITYKGTETAWDEWETGEKVGDVVRKIHVTEVQDENFTMREEISYTVHLPDQSVYVYVNLIYEDGDYTALLEGDYSSFGSYSSLNM